MREIGSEFWLETEPDNLSANRDGTYLLSGRTAIDAILQDILRKRQVTAAYLPAYSCDSMVVPFLKRGIKVSLYDMWFDGELHYDIDDSIKPDIFYVNNYFGYDNTISNEIISHFKSRGSIIIYDRTHSFLSKNDNIDADYSFASIRKWMGVVAGAVADGIDNITLNDCPYLDCKLSAMRKKASFIYGDTTIDKQSFLDEYSQFGHHLSEDYENYRMDDLSCAIYTNSDLKEISDRRQNNARYLHDNLSQQFIGELTDDTTPLFVPLFFKNKDERDRMRKHLIEHQIYCPVHWSKNQLVTDNMKVNKIIDTELSLICDQRYDVGDMERMVKTIKNFTA